MHTFLKITFQTEYSMHLLLMQHQIVEQLLLACPRDRGFPPLKFLEFMNDIADNLLSFSRIFADETSLLSSPESTNEM